jgi:hypothetical protein
MAKIYIVPDLFFTSWNELPGKKIALVYQNYLRLCDTAADDPNYGFLLISVLRGLRKNWRLVDKVTVEQAVDIFNSLLFLHKPWYFFPFLGKVSKQLHTPDDQLARHTFDHFIYADHEYSSFLLTNDINHLKRLVATLYQKEFDKEAVADLALGMKRIKAWELDLVFFTFAHVRNAVVKRCKTLMPTGSSGDDSDARATGAMWLKLKHRLAETPAFQGYATAGKSNMYSTLDYLEDLAKQREEKTR